MTRLQRRMAAQILGVGESRVWIDPDRKDEVQTAITKDDVRKLIKRGIIRKKPEASVSRGRKRARKGKRRGPGSRKGAIESEKEKWMRRVRALRKTLSELREKGAIERSFYRELYRMVKGGFFRDRSHLLAYLRERGVELGEVRS